ncbi:MAG: hypothetical protein ACOYYJ_03215 [Chloroflexota bacterium]
MKKTFAVILLMLSACAAPAAPTADLNAVISLTSQSALTSTAAAQPTAIPMSETPSTAPTLPPPTNTLPAAPTETITPTLVSAAANIFNQACAVGSVTNFNACTDSYCCETNAACNNDLDCVAAAQCFQQNGGMRGYGGISNCYQMPGAEKYMQNFACRFQYCGQFMTLNEGELCLTEKCAEVTAACFSNPDCFALKFCIVDQAGTPAECRQRHPEGIPDFERWTACGNETGCFALMP